MTFALAEIPSKLDQLTHRYNVGHVKDSWHPDAVVECHPGTRLPKRVSGMGELAACTIVYRQEWHCCGEYGCSSGTQKDSATKLCSATALLQVLSTGVIDEFVAEFIEPPIEDHGAGYVAPSVGAPPRYVHQLRVRLHELSQTALDYDEMVEQLEPHLRPVGAKAVKEYKRRFQNLTQSKKRPAPVVKAATKRRSKSDAPVAKKSRSRSKSTAPNDAASAAAMLVGLSQSSVLVRREARAWRDRTDIELAALPDVDEQLAALALSDSDDLELIDDQDDAEDDDVVIVNAKVSSLVPYVELFSSASIAPIESLLVAKSATDAEHVELEQLARQLIARFQRPLADEFKAATADFLFTPIVDRATKAAVLREWWAGQLLFTANSTARGQCLFSSVGLLLCGSGSDAVSLWLRARCVFELVEHWALYTEWFNAQIVRDMLFVLVGKSDELEPRYGYAWVPIEVNLLLANLLERRVVIVKKFSRQMSRRDPHTEPHVHLPLRRVGVIDDWRAREPLVLLFSGDHYRPLRCSEWLVDFRALAVEYNVASVVLSMKLGEIAERGCCGEVKCHQLTE
jgi:hypothetical protein